MGDILNDDGYRVDGRRSDELRRIVCKVGHVDEADGSAYLEQGNTKVVATVFGPHAISNPNEDNDPIDACILNCTYNISSFSMPGEHRDKQKQERVQVEIGRQLKQTFEASIDTKLHPECQIDINVEVIQSDGSNYSVCVNAATIALLHAGVPMKDYVFSCVCTFVDDCVLIDSNNYEQTCHNPELTISILPREEMIAYLQVSCRLHEDQLPRMIKEAIDGCHDIKRTVDQFMKFHLVNVTDY